MEIPPSVLQALAAGIIAFVFRVVFGLINKNEEKSDASDRRIEDAIKELRHEIKDLERKFVANDRELYVQVGEIRETQAHQRGLHENPDSKSS
jgi:signal transduction protein with GAF and PtsI domain